MTKTFLQEGLDAYARGDYLAAARAWCRGRLENPKDQALQQYLQFLRSQAPAVVLGAEEEAAAVAKADRAAVVVKDPGGTIAPLVEAPEHEFIPGRTIDMAPTEIRPNKTLDMRPADLLPNKTIDMQPEGLEPEDFPEPQQARTEEGRAEWSPLSESSQSTPVSLDGEAAPVGHVESIPAATANDDAADERAPVDEPRDEEVESAIAGKPDPWGEPALLGRTTAVDSRGPGLALVAEANKSKPAPVASVASLAARMRDAAGLDDFSGALKAADELLAIEPLNVDAKRIRERARSVLTQMLISELGTLDAIPMVMVAADQVIWLDLDQRAGFVLAQVDGRSSFSDIVAVTGMDELETLGILARLVRDKIVAAH